MPFTELGNAGVEADLGVGNHLFSLGPSKNEVSIRNPNRDV